MFFLCLSQLLGFVSSGLFYGTASTFLANTTPRSVAIVLQFILLTLYIILVLISITMGKQIRMKEVDWVLKKVTIIFCCINVVIVITAMILLFSSNNLLTYLTVGIFFATYTIPPLVYERGSYFKTFWTLQLPGMLSYIACMPLYQIVFQLFAYANLHDVSWGNRASTADADLQKKN